jgi:hypothetical protein
LGLLKLGGDGIKAVESIPGLTFSGLGGVELFRGKAGAEVAVAIILRVSGPIRGILCEVGFCLPDFLEFFVPGLDLWGKAPIGVEVAHSDQVGEAFGAGTFDGSQRQGEVALVNGGLD